MTMMCKTNECKREAENKVFWPGKTTELCGSCTVRAVKTARAMSFDLATEPLGLPNVEEIKEKLRTMGK